MPNPAPARTLEVLTLHWWSLVARGAAAIVFGVAVFATPELTLDTLAALFAAYAVADGALTLVAGHEEIPGGARRRWSALRLEGIAGILVGVVTWLRSELSVGSLLLLVGAWAIGTGALQIVTVVRLGRFRRGEALLAMAGAVSTLFGIALVLAPVAGLPGLGVAIAGYALGFGGLLIALGLRLRARARRGVPPAPPAAPPAPVLVDRRAPETATAPR